MITKIREKFLKKDIQKFLLMEDSPAKDLALNSLKSQAIQMYKSGQISQKFFYSTFFTFHKDQKFWEIHRDEMRKILKKQLTIPKLGVIIKKKRKGVHHEYEKYLQTYRLYTSQGNRIPK